MSRRLYDLAGADERHRFSPFCWRARMALAHKGLDYETEYWRFTETDRLAFSGQGRVPVLVDGDRIVPDSWTIAQYLDGAYPDGPKLFPTGEADAWLMKHWVETAVHPAIHKVVLQDLTHYIHDKDKDYFHSSREKRFGMTIAEVCADRAAHLAHVRTVLQPARLMLADRQWLAGGSGPTFTDYILFGALQWARLASPCALLAEDDPLDPWMARMLDLFDGLGRNAWRPFEPERLTP